MDITLKCNSAQCGYTTLEGKGYRTSCGHVYCEACAYKAFAEGNRCPICSAELKEGEVNEFLIGISTGPISKYLYQSAFQTNSWLNTLDNTRGILKSTLELVSWTHHQILYEASKNAGKFRVLLQEAEYHKSHAVKIALQLKSQTMAAEHRIKELEQQLMVADKDVKELKGSLTEKSKKCDSWEKAYNSIRSRQLSSDSDLPEVTTTAERPPILLNLASQSWSDANQSISASTAYSSLKPLCTPTGTPTRIVKRTELTTYRQTTSDEDYSPNYASSSNHFIFGNRSSSFLSASNGPKESPSTVISSPRVAMDFQSEDSPSRGGYDTMRRVPTKSSFFTSRK